MPVFATGNAGWDQGLNSLAGSLFPDPSKQAQAGYYGAETGQALVKSYQLRDQMGETRRLQDLLAGGGPIVGPAAPGGPPTPPGATPVIPYTSPTPAPSLATTVAPGAPPSAPNPAAAPTPGTGTDGGPTRPDAPPPLAGGGGTTRAPPAQANGQPVSPQMSLPYLMVTAARAGIDPNVVKLLGTSWINEQMRLGKMDRATGERFLSGAGDPTPLTSATQITTEGMRNATTLALPGATADAAIRQNDATIMMVVPRGKNVAEPHTVGEIKAHPELYENYDAARAAAGDVPKAVSSEPGNPAAPSVYTPTRDATGQTAPNTTIQETDATSITVVTPDHRLISSTVGALKAHPEMGRRATDADLTYANASPTLGAPPVRAPQATLGTSRPLPQSTDALAAENAARTGAAVEGGAPATAETIAAGTRAGLETQQTRTTLTPDQELRISGMVDQTVQQMYPVPGGFHWSNTSALAALSATKKAEVISRVRDLAQTAKYRTDPAAAVPAVLQQMQAEGKLPKAADRGLGWFSHTAPYLTGGKDPRFIVDEAPALAGTVTQAMPGGGGAQPAPAQTAPAQAVPTVSGPPPPGALGPAPPGAVEGQTGTGPGGVKGVVKGGWMMPLTAAAAPTTAPAQAAPAASPAGPSLADTVVRAITAPARAVKSRMRPRAPKGALSADQVPPS